MSSPTSSSSLAHRALVLNVQGGGRLCLPGVIDQTASYIVLEQEDWFEDEIRFVRRWLQPGMHVVDIGANYGVYTVAAARAVGSEGRVWAFEPTPQAADFLEATLQLNNLGQVSLSRSAVSSRSGAVVLAVGKESEGNRVVAVAAEAGETIEVPAVTLVEMAEEHDWRRVDFVKLDIEGHELEAITGGAAFLENNSPLLMLEIKAGRDFDFRPLAPLEEMGYQFYTLLPGMLVLAPFDLQEPVDSFLLNLFACKPEQARQLATDGFLAHAAAAPQTMANEEVWDAYAGAAPYALELAARWHAASRSLSGTDGRTYLRGLAAFARSRDERLDATERRAWLHHATECVEEAVSSSDRLEWKISYARLAWELGWRDSAVGALIDVAERMKKNEVLDALAGPFLAPAMRYERLLTAGRPGDWLRCAVIEQLEKLRAYSSMFLENNSSLALLEPILDLPFRSPEMDRRWQLVRMTAGLQTAPERTPLLCARSHENLNPEFWCGSQRT